MANGVDLFAPSEGLAAAEPVAGTDLFADPNAPGPLKKGVKASVAGLKSTGYGALALVGDLIGSQNLKNYGLQEQAAKEQEAGATSMRVEDIKSFGDAVDFAKYGTGYILPQLAVSLAAGAAGRGLGAAAARGVANPAIGLAVKNAGLISGLAGSSIAQEAGTIYPDAVAAGLPDAAVRAIVGGAAAGSLDILPEMLAARALGIFGRRVLKPGQKLDNALVRGAKAAGIGATTEAATEGVQTGIERLAGGQSLGDEAAMSDYLNSMVLGAIGGGVVGAPIGAMSRPAAAPAAPGAAPIAPTAPAAAPTPAPVVPSAPTAETFAGFPASEARVVYSPESYALTGAPYQPSAVEQAQAQLDQLQAQAAALAQEPSSKTRTKEAIARDRKQTAENIAALTQRVSNMKTLAETPEYQAKGTTAEPTIIGAQPEQVTPAKPIMTLEEDALLRQAEQEDIHAARQGNFQTGIQQERGYGAQRGPTVEAGVGNRVQYAARGATQSGPQGSFEAQLGRLKRGRGLLLSTEEATALRAAEKAQPGLIVEPSTARETAVQLTPELRREAFVSAYEAGVDNILAGFAQRGTMKPERAMKLRGTIKSALRDALAAHDQTAGTAAEVLDARLNAALKGKLAAQDVPAFKQDLAQFIAKVIPAEATVRPLRSLREEVAPLPRQETLFNKGARDDYIEFSHWGEVPNNVTDPEQMGAGKRGADWQTAATVGLKYTSAVVRGTQFAEAGVTERKHYVGRLRADKVYTATADDPLLAQAQREIAPRFGNSRDIALAQYAKLVRDMGYDAMLYPEGQLRIFTPQRVQPALAPILAAAGMPEIAPSVVNAVAKDAYNRHVETGGSTTFVPSGRDATGMSYYAVSTYKEREVKVLGQPHPAQIASYIRANEDLLADETNTLGTWYNEPENITYLDVAKVVPHMHTALALAREHNQIAFFDLRTMTNIDLGHPLFDVAQQYNAQNDLPPIQAVPYVNWNPDQGKAIARAFDQMKKFNDTPKVRESFAAMAAEEEQMFNMVSKVVKIEPWTKEGQPYQNSAEMRSDVFGNNHLYVFQGGEPHPLRTPEQIFRGRAVHDLFGHARTGFEFGPRGELNATRSHAQMYSEKALPALISDNIGQNAWVNFSDANEGLPQAKRAFAEQKVDLVPDSLWRPLLDHSMTSRAAAWERRDAVMESKGAAVLDYLDRVIGSPSNLEVRFTEQLAEGVGVTRLGRAKSVIELALNAKDILSVAAHEGFHYIDQRVLPAADQEIIRRAFERGKPMYIALIEKTREYDRVNGTQLTPEVAASQLEARAYGFEFWRRGELTPTSGVERVFKFIKQMLERVKNFVDGVGFSSYEDVFRAVERGDFARRELPGLRSGTVEQAYIEAIEPDALPGSAVLFRSRKEAKQSKGRPSWIKTPTDLRKMRGILRHLTKEGDAAKDWYRRSAQAILRWAGGDVQRAGKLAAMVAMYSPRTPVGLDLRHAVQHFLQWEAGQPIDAGGTQKQKDYGNKILDGTGYKDYLDKYVLPGRPDAPKINSFFKNLMMTIDPVAYPSESQDSTIDMWMSHIFGFGDKGGKINDSEYWWADAEIKRLAREQMLAPDQVQAAIWVAIKARGNMVRSLAREQGITNGWFKKEATAEKTADMFGGGGRVKYTLNPKHEFKYMVNWIRLALSAKFSQSDFDAANYSYAEGFRDIADRTIPLNRLDMDFELEAGMFDDIANGKTTDGALTLYSRAASLVDMAQRVRDGEVGRPQLNAMWADIMDSQPADEIQEKVLGVSKAEVQGAMGSVKRLYSEYFSSGLNLARNSEGYKNVFNVLTAYTQRKSRLIADSVENQLSEWVGKHEGTQQDKEAVSRAMLTRTENAYTAGSPGLMNLRATLSEKQRHMFDQATQMIANQLDAEFKADITVYRKAIADDAQFAEWYRNRSGQVERLKNEGYFPERRYGDHVVHAYVAGENGKKITVYYSQHEREADAREELTQIMQAIGYNNPGISFEYGYRYRADYDASLSFGQFLDIAQRQGITLTQAEKERIGKVLIAADNTRRNRVFRRKNIAGASTDGMRVLAEFGVTTSNKVAYAELGEAINNAVAGKEVNVRFDERGQVEVNTYDRDMWALDGEQAGFYRNVADKTVSFAMSPRDTSKISRFAHTYGALHFLGGSMAAAMVNMTSLGMNTVPWLTQHTSYTDAFAKTAGAAKLAGQHLSTIRDLPKLLDSTVRMDGIDEVSGLRRALQIAAQDGTILDTEIYQIMGLSRGQQYSFSGRVQKAINVWMSPFKLSEQFNRVTTFVSAYKIAIEKNMPLDAAYKFAQDTVYATQFRYDESNRPALARGNVGSLLFMFKTYPIYATEMLVHMARENPKSAVYMMLSLAMMSGLEGLPFAEDIEDLIDTIAQRIFGSPFNSKRALRNVLKDASEAITGVDLSNLLVHGPASELTGLSISTRVGLGNMIPGTRLGAGDADYKRVVSDMAGPVGALAMGVAGGLDSFTRGHFEEAGRKMLPLAGQNLIKSWTQFEKGFATDMGGRKLIDVGGVEAFFQAVGFTSSALTKAYDADSIDKQTLAFYTQVQQDITKDLVKAVREGRTSDADAIVAAIGTWNTAYPEMPMVISPSGVRRNLALAGMSLNERTFKLLPRQLRGSSEAAIGLED